MKITFMKRMLAMIVGMAAASTIPAIAQQAQSQSKGALSQRGGQLKYNFNYGRTYGTELYFFMGASFYHDDLTIGGVYGPGENSGEWTVAPATIDLKNAFTLGIGVAYNFNEHLTVRGEFSFADSDYSGTWSNGTTNYRVSGDATLSTGQVGLQYNILKGPITPFVGAGIGVSYLDTDLAKGPPSYWHDWWGYRWSSYPTRNKTYFSYYGTIGLRWDFHRNGTAFISATSKWLNAGGDSGQVRSTQILAGAGWCF